jgi:hypothetical protein
LPVVKRGWFGFLARGTYSGCLSWEWVEEPGRRPLVRKVTLCDRMRPFSPQQRGLRPSRPPVPPSPNAPLHPPKATPPGQAAIAAFTTAKAQRRLPQPQTPTPFAKGNINPQCLFPTSRDCAALRIAGIGPAGRARGERKNIWNSSLEHTFYRRPGL